MNVNGIRRRLARADVGQLGMALVLIVLLVGCYAMASRWDELDEMRDQVQAQRARQAAQLTHARRVGWLCGYAYARDMEAEASPLCPESRRLQP